MTPQNLHAELPSNGCAQRPSSELQCFSVAWALVKMLVNPVSLRDGELHWTGLLFYILALLVYGCKFSLSTWTRRPRSLQTPLVPSGIEGIRPDGGWWLRLQPAVRSIRCCPFFALYSHESTELPATTEGRWRRRHLSLGHKAGLRTVL